MTKKYSSEELRALYEAGNSHEQIVELTGLGQGTVIRKLKAAQTPMRPRGKPISPLKLRAAIDLLIADWTPEDVAAVLKLSVAKVREVEGERRRIELNQKVAALAQDVKE